jgi:hypothetical protein
MIHDLTLRYARIERVSYDELLTGVSAAVACPLALLLR